MTPTDGYSMNSTTPGVALFDNPTSVGKGWASSAGAPPYAIDGTAKLTTAGLWMLNLGFNSMRDTQLDRNNRFRGADYLKTGLSMIAQEIGCASPGLGGKLPTATGSAAAGRLSALFRDVMDVSCRLGLAGAPAKLLLCGFRKLLYAHQEPHLDPMTKEAAANACERWTDAQVDAGRNRKFKLREVVFVRHRWTHARDVLSQQVPYGRWRSVPLMTAKEIVRHPLPLLLEIHVNSVEDSLSKIVNFGGHGGNIGGHVSEANAQPRRWMTAPEYVFLSSRAEISIKSILEAEGYMENPLLASFPEYGSAQNISPAFQLAIESYWTAGLSQANALRDNSPVAAWMSAYDRIACLRDALHLVDRRDLQVDIKSYGIGKIKVNAIDSEDKMGFWLFEAVRNTALIPPMSVDAPFKTTPVGNTPIELLQTIQVNGCPSYYPQLDARALEKWDERLAQADVEANAH